MNTTKKILAVAILSTVAVSAQAGGLAPVAVETAPAPMVDTMPMAPAGSINSGYVVLGLLAALVAASGSF